MIAVKMKWHAVQLHRIRDKLMNRFYGMQAGAQIDYEKNKNYGHGNVIISKCPVCGESRRKRSHPKCSREMQRRRNAGEL